MLVLVTKKNDPDFKAGNHEAEVATGLVMGTTVRSLSVCGSNACLLEPL